MEIKMLRLPVIFYLFQAEDMTVKKLLKLFVSEIDAELLKTIGLRKKCLLLYISR